MTSTISSNTTTDNVLVTQDQALTSRSVFHSALDGAYNSTRSTTQVAKVPLRFYGCCEILQQALKLNSVAHKTLKMLLVANTFLQSTGDLGSTAFNTTRLKNNFDKLLKAQTLFNSPDETQGYHIHFLIDQVKQDLRVAERAYYGRYSRA